MATLCHSSNMFQVGSLTVEVRIVNRSELDAIIDLIRFNKWLWTRESLNNVMDIYPNVMTGVFHQDKLLGYCACMELSPQLVYVSQLITHIDYRKLGIASKLVKLIQENYSDRNIILDAANTAVDFYKRLGFKHNTHELNVFRMQGVLSKSINNSSHTNHESGIVVKRYNESMEEKVLDYDHGICKVPRDDLTRRWLKSSKTYMWIAGDDSGDVVGVAVVRDLRPQIDVVYICRLHVDSPDVADSLVASIVEHSDLCDREVRIYFVDTNRKHVMKLFRKYGFDEKHILESHDVRMYTGASDTYDLINWNKVYSFCDNDNILC